MRNLILLATLICHSAHALAQGYVPYSPPAYVPPAANYYNSAPRTNSHVQTIDNNGPQVQQRLNAERMNRQIEYNNAIINYETYTGDRYRERY